jgi:preprotein translocase subunit YajC
MEPLIVLAVTFVLLWVLFILPQQRRVRAHQALVASVEPGDEVVLSAGIYGRVVELSADELTLAVAPGVELRVARQAVLRRVEDARGADDTGGDAGGHEADANSLSGGPDDGDAGDEPGDAADAGAPATDDTTTDR